MNGLRQRELERLRTEARRHAQAERRTPGFTVQLVVMNAAFAVAPAVPGAEAIFGVLPISLGVTLVAISMTSVIVNSVLYRRIDPDGRLYRATEAVEIALLYSAQVAFVYFGGIDWSPLWALCPFAALFFALTQPFATRASAALFAGVHGLFALAALIEGRGTAALISVAMGLVTFLAYSLLASVKRTEMLAIVDRNVVRGEAATHRIDHEKAGIAAQIGESVSLRLANLIGALETLDAPELAPLLTQANAARREVVNIAAQARPVLPDSLSALAVMLERRLAPLCVEATCTIERTGLIDLTLEPSLALALLRITQELVRNAITHGGAKDLSVVIHGEADSASLVVRDDGIGLHADVFAQSPGGLRNVRRWAEEQGGSFHHHARSTGTELRVSFLTR